jgi:uncharacterized damage-inducible protein DinB
MFTVDMVINAYARNLFFIKNHTQGFSHADALLQPHARGNCANWVLGHIAAYRDKVLDHLGLPAVFGAAAARYQANTPPVLSDGPDIAQLGVMLEAVETAQGRIEQGLRAFAPERAAEVITFAQREMTRAEAVLFLLRHEAYHTGQLELLAELPKS